MKVEDRIKHRAEQAIKDHVFPGCVLGIIDLNGNRQVLPFGSITYDSSAPRVTEETLYDVASITKTVPVGLLAVMFLERGWLRLEDQIVKYLPEITIEHAEKGLIVHLLTYTYVLRKNIDPNFSYAQSTAKDIFEFLFKRDFEYLPGTHYQYANTTANLLGIILERISGKKLYDLAQELVLDPLEMKSSTFHPTIKTAVPPTEVVSWRGVVQGTVHDETASILQKEGYQPGCAGLFSTAHDLLNVVEMILYKGYFRGVQLFNEPSFALMTQNALAQIEGWSTIGWELNQAKFMGSYSHERMIGKTGFTGTSCVVDPMRGRGVVILSNRTYPHRGENAEAINAFRRDVADTIFIP